MSSTAEKNILVLFNTIPPAALKRQEALGNQIGKAAKASNLFQSDDLIKVSIFQADLNNESLAVLVIIPEEKKENFGRQMNDFKQLVLEDLRWAGIEAGRSGLRIDIRSNQEIDKLRSWARARAMDGGQGKEIPRDSEYDYEQKAKQFVPAQPLYSFDRVILPEGVLQKIEEAIAVLSCEDKVFREWGLYEIQPHPSTSLSFYGPPGTGKTMAAEAVAEKLGKKVLKVSYADVESKYHGEGPKMVKAIFLAAEKNDAVLFFDEADSLLSKRLTNVSQGSEQSINSMRSQLLICLEEFRGIVIFATNLVVNYDKAFLTRLISVEFPLPDLETRKKIWDVHIRPANDGKRHQLRIPLASDVNTAALAERYDFVGREIRNAVVSACVRTAMAGRELLTQSDFLSACDHITKEREALAAAKDHTKPMPEMQKILQEAIPKRMERENGGS